MHAASENHSAQKSGVPGLRAAILLSLSFVLNISHPFVSTRRPQVSTRMRGHPTLL